MSDFFTRQYYLFFFLLLFGVISAAFYVGFLFGRQKFPSGVALQCTDSVLSSLTVPVAAIARGDITKETQMAAEGAFVGSKNGTKYYRPHCGSVKRIKSENYIWFANAQEAQLQGYTAGAC